MATVRSIIAASLRRIGVLAEGETPSAVQANDGLESLNALLDQWAADRLQIPVVLRSILSLESGVGAYRLSPVTTDATLSDGFDDTAWSGFPPGWTLTSSGSLTLNRDTSHFQSTPNSILMATGSSGSGSLTRDVVCSAGTRCNLSFWMGQNASTPTDVLGSLTVLNLWTNLYLGPDGTWGTAEANAFEATNDSGTPPFVRSTMEFYLDPGAPIGSTLRFSINFSSETGGDLCFYDTFDFTNNADLRERPVYVDHVNYIDSNNNDELEITLQPLTDDAWSALRLKPQTSPLPIYYYYNPTFPYGSLNVWPVPNQSGLTLVVYAAYPITKFASTTAAFYLPPGYERMIVTNLALELAPEYGAQPSPLLMQQAQDSKETIKRSNVRVADLRYDAALLGGGGRRYDIRTG
jgi:hypothetical protein